MKIRLFMATALSLLGPAAITVVTALTATPGLAAQTPAPAAASPGDLTIDARPWPRSYKVDGVEFSLYRPQIDAWTNNKLQARAVMAVNAGTTKDASGKSVAQTDYGAIWLSAVTETDKEAREVVLEDLMIERANFPTAKAQEARYLAAVRKAAPTTRLVTSLNQIEASLALTQAGKTAGASLPIDNDPPEILFAFQPTILVLIDGAPVLRASDVAGVERVINTRAILLKSQGVYYLTRNDRWATASSVEGPWTPTGKPLAPVAQAAAKLATASKPPQPDAKGAAAPAATRFPAIIVRTRPAELIVVEGDPTFAPIAGTSLKFMSNTPADVLIVPSGDWYVLIAGRWFTASSSKGPWRWVDPKTLPADFAKIPSDGPKGAVLASIPGTPEAQEALVANAVPQTATINRKEAKFQAQFDGAPQFKPIEGTSLSYAVNSQAPVISAGSAGHYALQNGVWFTAASPAGPWAAATQVPAEIYKIPSNSPLHYVTYVSIYGTSGDEIYAGYTPGYYGTVVNSGVVVYGSGYPCSGWTGTYWYGCPSPYGYGAAFGYGVAVGWALTFGWGWYDSWYDPWWGPWGYPGYYPGYYPGGAVAGNVYGRWGASVVAGTGAAWANPYTGNYGRAGQGGYYNTATGGRGYGYAGRNTNVYTGNSTAAAGGVRYNPQTGRVVSGQGGSVSNIYTGQGVAGGSRTVVNTNTGRVTHQAGVAGRGQQGAGAVGGFNTQGPGGGQASGAGYIHYDRATGDVSKGGVVNVNGDIYAGKDGNVYKRNPDGGWEQAGAGGGFSKTDRPDPSLDRERMSRDRGVERDRASSAGNFEQRGASQRSFDRGSYGSGYSGRMGGARTGAMRGGGGRRR